MCNQDIAAGISGTRVLIQFHLTWSVNSSCCCCMALASIQQRVEPQTLMMPETLEPWSFTPSLVVCHYSQAMSHDIPDIWQYRCISPKPAAGYYRRSGGWLIVFFHLWLNHYLMISCCIIDVYSPLTAWLAAEYIPKYWVSYCHVQKVSQYTRQPVVQRVCIYTH